MYKIDRRGGGQKSFTRTDPNFVDSAFNKEIELLASFSLFLIIFPPEKYSFSPIKQRNP